MPPGSVRGRSFAERVELLVAERLDVAPIVRLHVRASIRRVGGKVSAGTSRSHASAATRQCRRNELETTRYHHRAVEKVISTFRPDPDEIGLTKAVQMFHALRARAELRKAKEPNVNQKCRRGESSVDAKSALPYWGNARSGYCAPGVFHFSGPAMEADVAAELTRRRPRAPQRRWRCFMRCAPGPNCARPRNAP
jgi:hypothetical protein